MNCSRIENALISKGRTVRLGKLGGARYQPQISPGIARLLGLRPLRGAVLLPERLFLTRYADDICVILWYRRIRLAD
jgi:hypothetical protein